MSILVASAGLLGGFDAPAVPAEWNIVVGDGSATVESFPPAPTTPAWDITVGDTVATVNAYPGQP
jgi:hypothetical protein